MSMKLYVGNLAFQTSSEDLQQLFGQVGTVQSASVIEDRETGRSRGFAFVEMASKEEGESAIAQFNGKEFNGRNLTVNEARPREDRGGNRGGFARDGPAERRNPADVSPRQPGEHVDPRGGDVLDRHPGDGGHEQSGHVRSE